jgi:hypothetical protein
MLIATGMKWRRVLAMMRGSRQFTVTSCLQYGQPSWLK